MSLPPGLPALPEPAPVPEPVAGTPYHRLLARPRAIARAAAVLLLAVIGVLLLSVVGFGVVFVAAWAVGTDFRLDLEDGVNAGELLSTNLGLALLTPYVLLIARGVYGVRPAWVSSNRPGLRWRWLFVCCGLAFAVHALLLILGLAEVLATRESAIGASVVGLLVVVVLTTPLQASGEEYLFRGLLLQALGATRLGVWACCLVSGALFAAIHLQFQPPLFADRMLLGAAFAYLAIRTGGLEAPIAIHVVKNLTVLVPAVLLEETADALDPSAVTWIPVVVDVILLAILVPLVLRVARRQGIATPPLRGLRTPPAPV